MTNFQKNLVKQKLCTLHFIAHMTVISWKWLKSQFLTQNIEKVKPFAYCDFSDILHNIHQTIKWYKKFFKNRVGDVTFLS